ncbi:MAG: ABC transporter ATP-binding protein [Alicyclobacillus sp.]|nr:ABC transporter ATP-binding protein [Alicyclobacillus sp.]
MAVLALEGVSKRLGGRQIVQDLTMTVEPGEVYGFLGPNGAGKTTTIRMIVGLSKPSAGRIAVLGHDVQRQRAEALRHVGAIVENPELYGYLTGWDNLLHFARLAGLDNPRPRMEAVAELVGLKDRIHDKVRRYSLGMRQRLGVAQALLAEPKLLVLDEPTNGLDPAGMREFRELMRQLAKTGMAVFVSSHLLSEVQQMCDRVAILKDGRIVTEARVADLMGHAADAVEFQVGDVERTLALAEGRGLRANRTETGLVRVAMPAETAPAFVRALVQADVDVFAVTPERRSLEEAFLSLTDEVGSTEIAPVREGGGAHA